ncbi:hypothetical protein [Olsenella sp. AGMB03486]
MSGHSSGLPKGASRQQAPMWRGRQEAAAW